jgi:hypothetical protein
VNATQPVSKEEELWELWVLAGAEEKYLLADGVQSELARAAEQCWLEDEVLSGLAAAEKERLSVHIPAADRLRDDGNTRSVRPGFHGEQSLAPGPRIGPRKNKPPRQAGPGDNVLKKNKPWCGSNSGL